MRCPGRNARPPEPPRLPETREPQAQCKKGRQYPCQDAGQTSSTTQAGHLQKNTGAGQDVSRRKSELQDAVETHQDDVKPTSRRIKTHNVAAKTRQDAAQPYQDAVKTCQDARRRNQDVSRGLQDASRCCNAKPRYRTRASRRRQDAARTWSRPQKHCPHDDAESVEVVVAVSAETLTGTAR